MKKTLNNLLVLILFLAVIIGCTTDSIEENSTQDQNMSDDISSSVLKSIKSYGYKDDVIEDLGDYYLVDGDIVFYKNKRYRPLSNDPITKQRQHPNSVTISDISVFLNPGMDANWRNASITAINRWNSVNSSLTLTTTNVLANADIHIMYDTNDPAINLNANVFGRGTFPTADGRPGLGIWINPDFNSNFYCGGPITQNMRIANVQHELGHNLGITHTNQGFGSLIPGTPINDPQSVMNGGEACTINNFSNGDITAIEFLFPVVWVGPPLAYTRYPDPTICTNVFVQNDPYMLPESPGADSYELTSNSPNLYVDNIVFPGQEITMITSQPGNYTVTLKTTNSYGSSFATIYVTAITCGGGIGF